MKRILERFFRLFRFRRKEDNGAGPPVRIPDDDPSIDDKVLKTIANLSGPRRATHYRNGRAPRIFDKR